jgi:hypothetical protein
LIEQEDHHRQGTGDDCLKDQADEPYRVAHKDEGLDAGAIPVEGDEGTLTLVVTGLRWQGHRRASCFNFAISRRFDATSE